RSRIDSLDTELLELLAARMEIVKQIGNYKKANKVTALQIDRWSTMMEKRVSLAENLNLDSFFIKIMFQLIHEDSIRQQSEIMDSDN
ncbi:MAG: chorismate mutase, partial [Bacteroidota bacterium]|nr:chorismate mutase [Bacteroidota bacterium]